MATSAFLRYKPLTLVVLCVGCSRNIPRLKSEFYKVATLPFFGCREINLPPSSGWLGSRRSSVLYARACRVNARVVALVSRRVAVLYYVSAYCGFCHLFLIHSCVSCLSLYFHFGC